MKSKHPPGPAMTLGNMRELGVDCFRRAATKQWATPRSVAHRFFAIAVSNGR